ncbi:MAG: hypothetical protein JW768_16515 [Chitinispirillaceae bacterium]|nr:hypothetical protein [Chitinispirillaceae bacterium]
MTVKKIAVQAFCCACVFSAALVAQPSLTDASATYTYKNQSFKCGLYDGTNDHPAEHLADGMEIARAMRSMSRINIVPIGHSVPTGLFSGWNWNSAKTQFGLAANTNLSNACAPAVMAWDWIKTRINGTSTQALGGIAPADIHVLVVQLTWAPFMGPDDYEKNTPLQSKIDSMSHDLARLAVNAKKQFANLKMILFEADPWQNDHEPYHAYHEWFFNRQVVLNQIKGSDPNLAYKGANAKTVWVDLGGYLWKANDNRSYYTDCCHLSSAGATHFREVWVTELLKNNPVVRHWLSAEVGVEYMPKPVLPDLAIRCMNLDQGIEVAFSLFCPARVGLGLFTTSGQAVVPMFERIYTTGTNSVFLKPNNPLPPGAYIVRLHDGSMTQSRMVMTMSP